MKEEDINEEMQNYYQLMYCLQNTIKEETSITRLKEIMELVKNIQKDIHDRAMALRFSEHHNLKERLGQIYNQKVGESIFFEANTQEKASIRSAISDPARSIYRGKGAYKTKSFATGIMVTRMPEGGTQRTPKKLL